MKIIPINYAKKIKHHNFAKKPRKQFFLIQGLMYLIAWILLIGIKRKVTKVNLEGLKKKPFILLITHHQFLDFAVATLATFPRKVSNIVAIDAFDLKRGVLRTAGSIPKRKFVNELMTIKSIKHVLNTHKGIVGMYPEARYSQLGTNAIIPASVAKIAKLANVPMALMIFQGHYLMKPVWSDGKKRKQVPITCHYEMIISPEDLQNKSTQELDQIIQTKFVYDEWQYWQDAGFEITYKNRAAGLHLILYQCPHCQTEYQMTSSGTTITCQHCHASWELTTRGKLNCLTGSSEFDTVNKWTDFEREFTKQQILNGKYAFSDECEAVSMPHGKHVIKLGKVKVNHNTEGITISGHYNGQDFMVGNDPLENYSIQTEFNFPRLKGKHCCAVSNVNDTIYFYPSNDGYIQKLYFAVEELYILKKDKLV